MSNLLEVRGLSVDFKTPAGPVHALRDVDLDVPRGRILGIVGESGSGKSTVIWAVTRLLARNAAVRAGRVTYAGRDVLTFPQQELVRFRSEDVSVVFQDPTSSQIPVLSYARQMADIQYRRADRTAAERRAAAVALMRRVGIPDPEERILQYPHQFSGGMRQRAGIAMALLTDPALLIADEPTTALDVTMEAQIILLLRQLKAELDATVVVVSHNLGLIAELCDEVVVLYAGEVLERGDIHRIFATPAHPYTRALLECDPARIAPGARRLPVIAGDVPDLRAPPRGCVFAPRCAAAEAVCREVRPADSMLAADHSARCHLLGRLPRAAAPDRAREARVHAVEEAVIEATGIGIRFRTPGAAAPYVQAVVDVSLAVHSGETVGLVGESGSGKTTFAKSLIGLLGITEGSIRFLGRDVSDLREAGWRRLRREIAMMFQDPVGSLSPRQSVKALLAEPMRIHGIAAAEAEREAERLVDMVGLPRDFLDRYPHELSGGQARRVGVARALALRPRLVIADEPTAGLDVSVQGEILNLMDDLQREHGLSYLVITHNLPVVRHIADRIGIMYLGRLVEFGDAEAVFASPAHPYTQALIEGVPQPDPTRRRTLVSIEGEVPSLLRRPTGCEFHPRCRYAQARCRTECPCPAPHGRRPHRTLPLLARRMMVGPAQGGPLRVNQESARIVDPGELPYRIREVHHAWIPLVDGTRLACRYWLPVPADTDPVPAILEYIPYCKRDGTAARDEAMHPYFAGHGYAAIRVDMRGSGESDGVLLDEYLRQEQDDALEVIAWIAAQPWCTGKVGMMGKSWGGFNGLQVAARRPPALKAVISMYSTDDRYADDIHTMGGCQLVEHPNWSFYMFPLNARPPDPLLAGPGWEAMWRQRLEVVRPWIVGWLHHQRRDEFWKHGSVCEDYGTIQCPVYLIGGWADGYSNPVPHLMAGLSCPKKALIGPWGHQYQHQASPGPMMGYMTEALRWWDHWLKGVDTGIIAEPAYRVWMNDSERPQTYYAQRRGRWIAEPGWPSERIVEAAFHPDGAGRLAESPATARLTAAVPANYGACTPFWSNMGGVEPESPRDQRADDALGLTFTGPALESPLEIFGQPRVELELEVDQPTAFVSIRLCDVQPDGASTLVTYGLLNLTHDAAHETVTPLEPGRRYRASVALNDIAHRFLAGNRVRVSVGTGFWPVVWPSPRPVVLTLHTEGCRLVLPTRVPRPEDATLRPLPPPEHTAVQPVTMLRPAQPTVARIEEDLASGCVSFVHEEDSGKVRIDRDGWCFGARFERRFSVHPDDPGTARIELRAVKEFGREGSVQARIEAWQLMTSTPGDFRLQASIAVSDGGRPMLHRSWDETIPRDGC